MFTTYELEILPGCVDIDSVLRSFGSRGEPRLGDQGESEDESVQRDDEHRDLDRPKRRKHRRLEFHCVFVTAIEAVTLAASR